MFHSFLYPKRRNCLDLNPTGRSTPSTQPLYRLSVPSKEAKIPWASLKCQFGGGYEDTPQGVRSFKANFLKQLRGVLLYYPEARSYIDECPDYLVLKAGARPLVQQRVVM